MKRIIAALALSALSGCAEPQIPAERIATQEVPVAVAEKCVPNIGPEPQYVDSDAAIRGAANIFERVKLIMAGRAQRIRRDEDVKVALAACGADP